MKRCIVGLLASALLAAGVAGCGERIATKKETKITTPGGTTTITTEKEVKKTGDHPPPEP